MRYRSLLIAFALALAFAAPAICQSGNQVSSSTSLAAVVSDLATQVQKLSLQVQELQKQVAELTLQQAQAQPIGSSTASSLPTAIAAGSTKDDVLRIVGKCDRIETSGKTEFWNYGTSFLVFGEDGRVHGWRTGDHDIRVGEQPKYLAPTPSHTTAVGTVGPGVAENGSYYGQISDATSQPKTVHVNGYYRKDGTYVRGHYRSK